MLTSLIVLRCYKIGGKLVIESYVPDVELELPELDVVGGCAIHIAGSYVNTSAAEVEAGVSLVLLWLRVPNVRSSCT